ncbi:MAG: sigma-54-dependent Fis family transcriptional regulator [candidate division WOR-3 bacterium]|nr:sigma-54-dependent Fis family transcriptional regulator [candidate division WOR-3 bacterium]MDW8113604.1 sigma-54-dependent Fis family transcriptional regulator [candidate division WOR-3 bacterium]
MLERKALETLYQIIAQLNSLEDYKEVLENTLKIIMKELNAERGVIVLKEKEDFEPMVFSGDVKKISQSVIKEVLEKKEPILLHSALDSEEFSTKESVISYGIKSVMCVPLIYKDKLLGALYLDSHSQKGIFSESDLEFLIAYAHQASLVLENAYLREKLLKENIYLKTELSEKYYFENIIGQSKKMQEVFLIMKKVLNSSLPVLIIGETGTGKELVARSLHYSSQRRNKKFVPIYCGGLPETLLESELFGYKRGAFTGALYDKKGLIEEADGGTLFLDEIADIPLSIQAKLLRFLQEGKFRRIGETEERYVDCRVITATNKNLEEEIKKGNFREDLYYRLNVIKIYLPPLREREEDVILLSNYFLKKFSEKENKKIKGFSKEAIEFIKNYNWPGNVRELENKIAKAVALCEGEIIDVKDLIEENEKERKELFKIIRLEDYLKEKEREYLKKVLEIYKNKSEAARILGISRRTLYNRLKELGLE